MTKRPVELADCTVPLAEEEVSALHAYWEQVLAEVWGVSPEVPAARRSVAPVVELRRQSMAGAVLRGGEAA
ncbi:hypothetical protein Ae717Ps2_0369 [Pseudonocardia sp. Ae717_Ps2]|uniref:hypothetical protein n=1 Tax=unclassified Pseudonocardia TaxID=2619320 RepID=UPI00094ACB50|nr:MULTISPECIES: hypothetical protein [unclassified Pseudonocardia]OLM12106.1 hypothetical protein Ae505Ps2_2233 [Pseudonocardia sp. Ae505_Ps2]OLM29476.1 hypothetical protein Ae717Ps2_0369 [Pseudonocardia sp. Ae717_Ps2]